LEFPKQCLNDWYLKFEESLRIALVEKMIGCEVMFEEYKIFEMEEVKRWK